MGLDIKMLKKKLCLLQETCGPNQKERRSRKKIQKPADFLPEEETPCHDPLPVGIIAAAVGYLVTKLAEDKAEVNSIKLI